MDALGNFLHTYDYIVILGSVIICVVIGLCQSRDEGGGEKQNKVAQYFLGNRQMSILPIAISILATTVSAVPMVSGIGEMYTYGMEYGFVTLGVIVGSLLASYFIIPVFRYIEYVSIYEYLENRFDPSVRVGFSLCYIVMNLIASAVVLYLPALLIANVTGVTYWITASVSGVMCTLYCVLGGFKAVVWTDVVQFVFMLTGLVVIIWRGTIVAGGASYVWTAAMVDGFFKNLVWFDVSEKRFTFISAIIYGIFVAFQHYTTSQAVLQRILSVKDIKAAQRSIILTLVSRTIFIGTLVAAAGVIFANFHLCDPLLRAKQTGVKSSDLVLLYFLQKFLSDWPGLSGIVFAGILSSALSTLSSYINSFAASTLEDFIKPYYSTLTKTEKREIVTSKALTGIYGMLVLILSFLIPYLGGAIKAFISITGALGGPLTGIMFLALFVPRANKKTCMLGLAVGIAIGLWLTFASPVYRVVYQTLPVSTDGCLQNSTWSGADLDNSTTVIIPIANATLDKPVEEMEAYVFPLYKLSFVWYGPMGFLTTLLIGWWATLFCKGSNQPVHSSLLSPVIANSMKKGCCSVPEQDFNEDKILLQFQTEDTLSTKC